MWTLALLPACSSDAPRLAEVELLSPVVTEGQDVELLVEVADPDGADDLVAGWVEIDGAEVARLSDAGVAGTFEARIGPELWEPHVDDFVGEGALELRVVVTDTEGSRATARRRVTVACLSAWCGGGCVDLLADTAHCGACGAACDADQTCAVGGCAGEPGWTECTERDHDEVDCGATCAESGLVCGADCGVDVGLGGYWTIYADSEDGCATVQVGTHLADDSPSGCAFTLVGWDDPLWARCCCALPR